MVSPYIVHDPAFVGGLDGVRILDFVCISKRRTENTRILASHERVGCGQMNGQQRGDNGPSELKVGWEIK